MRPAASAGNARNTLARSVRSCALVLTLVCMVAAPAAASVTELNAVEERNLEVARSLLQTDREKIGAFYAACMNEAAARRAGTAPLQPFLARIDAITDRTSLSTALAALDSDGVNALWFAGVAVNGYGSPHRIVELGPRENSEGYHLISREQLDKIAPQIDWDAYFHARGFPAFSALNVTDVEYLRSLSERLSGMPLAHLKRLLGERLLTAFSPWLHDDAGGSLPPIPRWKRCVALIDTEMPDALGRAWVARAFSQQAKAKATSMVEGIMGAMRERLRGATWLSDGARNEALAKLEGMAKAIGYPDRWDDYDGAVEIQRDALLADILHARAARIAAGVAKLGAPVNRRSFGFSVLTANAYYAPLRNEIVVPAGLLQPPLFGGDDATDYGAAGAAIGHEIAHAFDETGRYFDAEGRLRDWWTPQDAREFAARAACTNDEGIADVTGVAIARDAFKKMPANTGADAERRFTDAFKAMWAGTDRADAALSSKCSVW